MKVLRKVGEIQNLPSIPGVVLQVHSLLRSGRTDAAALADIIAHDPSLASMVLRAANSVHYATASQRIGTIQNAIVRLGFETLSQLALTLGLMRQFPDTLQSVNHSQFWRHCIAAAYLADEIATHVVGCLAAEQRELVFTCGLLHDIGILIYDQFLHEEFSVILTTAKNTGTTFLATEKMVAGTETHAMVGGVLLELWHLSPAAISAIRYHHNPEHAPESFRALATVVHLSEHILCNSSIGSMEGTMDTDSGPAFALLGLDAATRQQLLVHSQERVSRRGAVLTRAALG